MLLGLGGEVVGTALTATGIGSVPGVVVIAGSTTIVVHGGAVAMKGTVELVTSARQLYSAIKRSGSEEIHKNPEGKTQSNIAPEAGRFSKEHPGNLTKLRGGQGWKDKQGNIWKKDMKHKDHWDVTDPKTGKKVKEIDFDGNQIWPDGPKNKNKQ